MNIDNIVEYSDGNIGALHFLLLLVSDPVESTRNIITARIEAANLKGTAIYILYNDICDRDINKVEYLCKSDCPNELLLEACSYDNYKGIELLEKYL